MFYREAREVFNIEKFQNRDKEDEVLTQLVMDTFFNMRRVKILFIPDLPRLAVINRFTTAIIKIQEHKPTTHTIFAATIMKDIHRILDTQVGRAHDETIAFMEECERLIWHATPDAPKGLGPY